jgi:hypothetical protein
MRQVGRLGCMVSGPNNIHQLVEGYGLIVKVRMTEDATQQLPRRHQVPCSKMPPRNFKDCIDNESGGLASAS